jgi:hypothetical protein
MYQYSILPELFYSFLSIGFVERLLWVSLTATLLKYTLTKKESNSCS